MSYKTPNGRRVRLGNPLGQGGEGRVLRVQGSHEVAKVYWPIKRTPELQRKLGVMVSRRPNDPMRASGHLSFAWPSDLLLDGAQFVGFLMPCLDTRRYRPLHMVYRPTDYPAGIDWRLLVQTARNLASAIDALHQEGYVAGDLNESNVLAATDTVVTVVDCDSMQVPDPKRGRIYRCTVGKPDYTAPELRGVDFSKIDRTEASDRFALAVLVCQLLVRGRHPFSGGPPALVADNIAAGRSIFSEGFSMAPGWMPAADLLPPGITRLFERAFIEGHVAPDRRPSATEWQRELDRLRSRLRACGRNVIHKYGDHLSACPWCELERRTGRRAFPGKTGTSARGPARRPRRQGPAPPVQVPAAVPAVSPPPLRNLSLRLVQGAGRAFASWISWKMRVAAMGCALALLLVIGLTMTAAFIGAGGGSAPTPRPTPGASAAQPWVPPQHGQPTGPITPPSRFLLAQAPQSRSDPGYWARLGTALEREGSVEAAAASAGMAKILSSEVHSAQDWNLGASVLELLRTAGAGDDEWLGDEADRAAGAGRKQSAQVLYYLAQILDPQDREWLQKIEPRPGLRVRRGIDWSREYADQDGGSGHSGVITAVPPKTRDGWVEVDWGGASRNWYRWGADGKFDLGISTPWGEGRA